MRKALLLSLLSLIAVQAYAADRACVYDGRSDPNHMPPASYRGSIPPAVAPPRISIADNYARPGRLIPHHTAMSAALMCDRIACFYIPFLFNTSRPD